MKIAFLCQSIFSDGGVQRVVTNISNMLSEEHEIDIICTNVNIKVDKKKYGLLENIKVIYEPIEQRDKLSLTCLKAFRALNLYTNIFNNKFLYKLLASIYYPAKQRKKLVDLVNKNKYDVIIGCEGYYSILLGIVQRDISTKTVTWQHSSYDAYFNTKFKYNWNREYLYKKYLNQVDKNIVLTNLDKQKYISKFGIKSEVLYNPLSFEVKKKADLCSNVIISAGRLTQAKGFDNLIKAFDLANQKSIDNWELWIYGDGEEKDRLKKIINERGLRNYVSIKPFTNEISEKLREASIYAMSSRWEGFGLVVIEAMESGLPIVSFDVSGPKEILDGYNCAILVKQNDISSYADALVELMNDYNKRKKLVENGLERVKDFHKSNILISWNNLLKDLVQ
ncbi:glycosyltransferase [Bacillus sp. FJAT-27986]|uniref:glycosyltransferase n=1 Tax=Bacillus sp. FJAT-27986 TaxID=1743146 RepID=UPI00080AC2EA|nr:glycosyltransferase [Bacillus sp. FJAT-27986]OCA84626.1 hypothetical protein A8L44_09495 [Bacillus sp. FJAT-27986]